MSCEVKGRDCLVARPCCWLTLVSAERRATLWMSMHDGSELDLMCLLGTNVPLFTCTRILHVKSSMLEVGNTEAFIGCVIERVLY